MIFQNRITRTFKKKEKIIKTISSLLKFASLLNTISTAKDKHKNNIPEITKNKVLVINMGTNSFSFMLCQVSSLPIQKFERNIIEIIPNKIIIPFNIK